MLNGRRVQTFVMDSGAVDARFLGACSRYVFVMASLALQCFLESIISSHQYVKLDRGISYDQSSE